MWALNDRSCRTDAAPGLLNCHWRAAMPSTVSVAARSGDEGVRAWAPTMSRPPSKWCRRSASSRMRLTLAPTDHCLTVPRDGEATAETGPSSSRSTSAVEPI